MKRKEDESYEDYKERRKKDNEKVKAKLKGARVWPGEWGTYIKQIHGNVEDRLKQIIENKNKLKKK